MIRVIIADDEEKVCRLIYSIIDWESIGMEVVGVANNGLEALDYVKSLSPDILITDIRMPGYDGLELIKQAKDIRASIEMIVISGYRHFEYAQDAIKYGVSDYLVKPIKKEDLLSALYKVKRDYLKRNEDIAKEQELTLKNHNDIERLRSGLFTECLFGTKDYLSQSSIASINDTYHFSFDEGLFQIVAVKIDCVYREEFNNSIKTLQDKIRQIIYNYLLQNCIDLEIYNDDSIIYILMNYKEANAKDIRKQIGVILRNILIQKDLFRLFDFTVIAGKEINDIRRLKESYLTLVFRIHQRLIVGTGKLIEGIEYKEPSEEMNVLIGEFSKSFQLNIEILNKEKVLNDIKQLEHKVYILKDINGQDIYSLVLKICQMYLTYLNNNQIFVKESSDFYEEFHNFLLHCGSKEELFIELRNTVNKSMDDIIEDKRQENLKPIRIAKQYIQENYMKNIGLDEVSSLVGFNASYFSVLFKKETNMKFMDYVSEVRMNRAKELLKETKLSISDICEKVGYSDIKYFTQNFKKITGIKPSEYRKLYS